MTTPVQRDINLQWNVNVFSFVPSYSTSRKQAPRLRKAQFGDSGYAVRAAEGLNHNPQMWDLVFDTLSVREAGKIDDFVVATKGSSPFKWTTPDGDYLSFVCPKVSIGFPDAGVVSVTLTFEQDFSP